MQGKVGRHARYTHTFKVSRRCRYDHGRVKQPPYDQSRLQFVFSAPLAKTSRANEDIDAFVRHLCGLVYADEDQSDFRVARLK